MIVLDTNVLSELMRSRPNELVVAWVRGQPRASLYATSLSEAELRLGIALLPEGRRRSALAEAARAVFAEDLAGRVLPFTSTAAANYATIVAARRRTGQPIEAFDALIAATALAVGAGIATRDTAGFAGCGLPALVNPWDAA